MKTMRYLICIILTLILCAGGALAVEAGMPDTVQKVYQAQGDALELDELDSVLSDEVKEALDGADPTSTDYNATLKSVLKDATGKLGGLLRASLKSSLLILAVVIIGGVAANLAPEMSPSAVTLATVLAVALISVSETGSVISAARESIEEMTVLAQFLLPVLGSAVAASGRPVSGTALYAATIAFSQLFMTLVKNYILPLTYAYIACGIANAAVGGKVLARMGKLIKWAINLSLTVLIFIYVVYLSMSGAVSGATDAVTVKAAKLTISTVVPVVGGMIADAAETVIAGASLLKNSVGIFGMLAVLAICLTPFLQIGAKYLVYKLTAALSATVGDEQVVGLIETISGAFGIVMGMLGTCALMLFVALISAVRMVTG